MPGPRGPQSSTTLYAVITLAALFVIATAFAVISYIKATGYKDAKEKAEKDLRELVTTKQRSNLAKIVGQKVKGQSRLETMDSYLKQTVAMIMGEELEDLSAGAKVEKVKNAYDQIMAQSSQGLVGTDAEAADVGLIRVAQILSNNLKNTKNAAFSLEQQLFDLNDEYDMLVQSNKRRDDEFAEQIGDWAEQARQTQESFNRLRDQMEQNTDEQIQVLRDQLAEAGENVELQHQQLLRERAKYIATKESRDLYKDQIDAIRPGPDTDVQAYKPDGKIISIDERAGIVFLNIGTDDHVYRGLTFSVYDKNIPLPKDGKGKAQVEVVDTERNISIARVTSSQKKNPIIPDDVVANLIWDSKATNIFVVAGDFDINGDSRPDSNGRAKILDLIEKWGGRVADYISVETDFAVLGLPPRIPPKPTHEQLEDDPMAMEKYDAVQKRLTKYKDILEETQTFSVPIFNTDRFLYFIGYHRLGATASIK